MPRELIPLCVTVMDEGDSFEGLDTIPESAVRVAQWEYSSFAVTFLSTCYVSSFREKHWVLWWQPDEAPRCESYQTAFCSFPRVPRAVAAKIMLAAMGWKRSVSARLSPGLSLGFEVGSSNWSLSSDLDSVTSFEKYRISFRTYLNEEIIEEELTPVEVADWVRKLGEDAPVIE
jgi:hypothetical protein